jgi:Fe-S-cluster-containing dehydrogenase component
MQVKEVERGTFPKPKLDYIPTPCQHCAEMPCARPALDGAVYRREDGVVMIDPVKAKGQKQIVNACPYRVIFWNEELQVPQKCTMCAHMLDAGEKVTRCSEVCPNQALLFGDLDDPKSEIAKYVKEHKDELTQLKTEYGTKPTHYYRHLPAPFVAGEVVCGDTGECCKGAVIKLTCDECGTVYKAETDFLGDFEIRRLPLNKSFTLVVKAAGYKAKELKVRTMAAVNLGEIVLEKA